MITIREAVQDGIYDIRVQLYIHSKDVPDENIDASYVVDDIDEAVAKVYDRSVLLKDIYSIPKYASIKQIVTNVQTNVVISDDSNSTLDLWYIFETSDVPNIIQRASMLTFVSDQISNRLARAFRNTKFSADIYDKALDDFKDVEFSIEVDIYPSFQVRKETNL